MLEAIKFVVRASIVTAMVLFVIANLYFYMLYN